MQNIRNIMKLKRLNDIRRGIWFQRHCYCTKDYSERIADFPDTYTWKNADHWYQLWEKNKYFQPKEKTGEAFKMILPPPNVTGVLHLGHALTSTIQDVLARWHRMKNESVIWVPGLDHAGIATQAVVEKYLKNKKGIGRYEMGKEELLSHIEQWKNEKGDEIRNQLKALGASLDWSREFFTMSKDHNKAVIEAFVLLSKRDLLYRSKSLINWSPTLQSTISEMEIEYKEITGKTDLAVPGYERKVRFGQIARVAYKLQNSDEEVVIATTRVETMLGDVALAVHPDDERYSRYIGQQVWHPLREIFIPIIQDDMVKRDFGTGIVKITPAHDHADLAVAKRHDLPIIDVIGNDGNMNANCKEFEGLARFVARRKILDKLASSGILRSLDNHEMLVPICSRSGDVVEHLIKEQWFLKTKEMANRAVQAVENGSLKIDPPSWANLWCDWLGNNRDWCVSRQIWWGHQIPAYRYKDDSNTDCWIVARTEEEARIELNRKKSLDIDVKLEQDEDVLDTWFSSALLPLSAMGWPNRTKDLDKYYPLSLMETGHDIVFLWVARMAMLGLELTDKLPFKEILFHGVLCDAHGKKMSKSRGNVIRPEHVINGISLSNLNAEAEENCTNGILGKSELKRSLATNTKMFPDGIPECGADALRFTLCSHNIKTNRISFNIDECRASKLFCNKIWQATKYVLRMTNENRVEKPQQLSAVDRWILSRLSFMIEKVNDAFYERNFNRAVQAIREFLHHEYCDFFLEATKLGFKSEQIEIIQSHRYTLMRCLEVFLRALAPLMPFIADDLYARCAKKLPNSFSELPSLLEAEFPVYSDEFEATRDVELEERFDKVLKVACTVRTIVAQINRKSEFQVHLVADNSETCEILNENINLIAAVTRVENVKIETACNYEIREDSITCGIGGLECRVYLLLSESDVDSVKSKIEKKRLSILKKLEALGKNTSSPKNAGKNETEKLRDREQINNLQEELKRYPTFV